MVGVRAEHFGAAGQGDADLKVKVDVVEHLGSTSFLYARTAGGEDVVIEHQAYGCSGRRRDHRLDPAILPI